MGDMADMVNDDTPDPDGIEQPTTAREFMPLADLATAREIATAFHGGVDGPGKAAWRVHWIIKAALDAQAAKHAQRVTGLDNALSQLKQHLGTDYIEARDECWRDQAFGAGTIIVVAINKRGEREAAKHAEEQAALKVMLANAQEAAVSLGADKAALRESVESGLSIGLELTRQRHDLHALATELAQALDDLAMHTRGVLGMIVADATGRHEDGLRKWNSAGTAKTLAASVVTLARAAEQGIKP